MATLDILNSINSKYDPTASGLTATDVKNALDELKTIIDNLIDWTVDQDPQDINGANIVYGTTASTACEGNDARLSDARTPVAHTHVEADITDAKVTLTDWTITQVGTEIRFNYQGTPVAKITSAGAFVAIDDITAFGTI